jgi:hypothetical protein
MNGFAIICWRFSRDTINAAGMDTGGLKRAFLFSRNMWRDLG